MGVLGSILTHCGSSRDHYYLLWELQGAFSFTVEILVDMLGSTFLTHCRNSREHSHPLWKFQGAFSLTADMLGSIRTLCENSREHSDPL